MSADLLRAARDLYAVAPSHAPAGRMPEKGCYCVLTAVYEARFRGDRLDSECAALIAMMHVTGSTNLVAWNAETSTEEVLAAFDAAIGVAA